MQFPDLPRRVEAPQTKASLLAGAFACLVEREGENVRTSACASQ